MEISTLYDKYLECNRIISIDSRDIRPGAMFFAIKGEKFDGNNFVDEVIAKKARYAVIDDPKAFKDERTILVEDCLATLQALATTHRRRFDIPVLAITGSNGKTTTKELINTVLGTKFVVHATKGNYNNHLGVPLTLLAAKPTTELMVIEMGANHIGEIAELCIIAEPNYGIITNIGRAHLEGFGSVEGVIQAKTELYKYIRKRKRGLIFYNPKDDLLQNNLPDGVRAYPYLMDIDFGENNLKVVMQWKNSSATPFSTQLIGTYNYPNIAAAMTIGEYFSVPRETLMSAVCSYVPNNNRSQLITIGAVTLIMDAYNANPSSMKRSIESLANNPTTKDKVLLLGDMKELGPSSHSLHQEILHSIEQYKWKEVILVGEAFASADTDGRYRHFENIEALSISKHKILTMLSNSICLVKASRSLQLEQVEGFF